MGKWLDDERERIKPIVQRELAKLYPNCTCPPERLMWMAENGCAHRIPIECWPDWTLEKQQEVDSRPLVAVDMPEESDDLLYWQFRVGEWVDAKLFPVSPFKNNYSDLLYAFVRKNQEESREFQDAAVALQGEYLAAKPESVEDEAADVVITVMAILHAKGLDLESGLRRKLPILEQGDWYYNQELGVFKRRK